MDSPFPLLLIAAGFTVIPFLIVSLTAFVKIAVVLFLVRNALGTMQTPPNIVLYGVTVVLTGYVMSPVFAASLNAVTAGGTLTQMPAPAEWPDIFSRGIEPVRDFLMRFTTPQDREFFLAAAQEMHSENAVMPQETDIFILAPAFVTAELTKAFQIGVLLYLPFIVVDLVVTNVLTALGMMMVSPTVISLPFKLLLFVAADGWSRLTHGLVMSYV